MGALNKQATTRVAPTIYERVYPYKPSHVYYFSVSRKFLSYPPRVYRMKPIAIAMSTNMIIVFFFSLINIFYCISFARITSRSEALQSGVQVYSVTIGSTVLSSISTWFGVTVNMSITS